MGIRREARERAIQFLFQYDLNQPENLDEALRQFWDSQRAAAIAEEKGVARWGESPSLPPPTAEDASIRSFAEPLIRGTLEHLHDIDELIKKHAKNWDLHRMAVHSHSPMFAGSGSARMRSQWRRPISGSGGAVVAPGNACGATGSCERP